MRHPLYYLLLLLCCCCALFNASADTPKSSISFTETYRDVLRNDPDFGPTVVPIVSSTITASLYTNVVKSSFTKTAYWEISFGQMYVAGTFTNDPNFNNGNSSATFPFVDIFARQTNGTIFLSWTNDHLFMRIITSSDAVDALDFYTGATGPIVDQSDLSITIGKFTNVNTIFYTGHNSYRSDAATGLDINSGSIVGKADFFAPTVSISGPPENTASYNSILNVAGTATDNIGVGSVMWRFASPGEDPKRGGAYYTDWTGVDVLPLSQTSYTTHTVWRTAADMSYMSPGTNRFWVTSQDLFGHYSAIATHVFFWSVPSILTLGTTEGGTIHGGAGVFNNASLIISRPYSVSAAATDTNSIFLNWTDGDGNIVSITPGYRFLMQDGLYLQANFGPNPFPAIKGTFNGLFYPSNGVNEYESGLFTINVRPNGTYTGKLADESGTYPFSGQFGFYGNSDDPDAADSSFSIEPKGAYKILGTLHIAGSGAGDGTLSHSLTGTVSLWDSRLNRRVIAPLDVHYCPPTTGDVQAGLYNFQIPSANGSTQVGPLGYGFGSINLRSDATATTIVNLADQTPVLTCASAIDEGGNLPVFGVSYNHKGIIIGWLAFTNEATSDLRGDNFHWIKRRSTATYFPDGFHRIMTITGCQYVAPKAGTNILGWTSGSINFADFAFTGSEGLAFDPTFNRFSFPDGNADNIKIAVTPATGAFRGTISNPALQMRGVILPKMNVAYGSFYDANQTGYVILATP